MDLIEFKNKYGVPIIGDRSFYDIYVEDLKVKNRNPIKILNMCKDAPFEYLRKEHPEKCSRLMHYMSLLEYRIADEKRNNKFYYETQIKPFL